MRSVNRAEVRVTKRGNVLRIIRENYLRTDIPCGHRSCAACPTAAQSLEGDHLFILGLDTMKAHVTVLEQQRANGILTPTNTIYLHSALIAVQGDPPLHRRIKEVVDGLCYYVFPNDHCEDTYVAPNMPDKDLAKAVRVAEWYSQHLPGVTVTVITESQAEGVNCKRLQDYAQGTVYEDMFCWEEAAQPSIYPDHLDPTEAKRKVYSGELLQGVFHIYRSDTTKGWVTVTRGVKDRLEVVIEGFLDINRAVEGDTVAVRLQAGSMEVDSSALLDTEAAVEVVAIGGNKEHKSESGLRGQIVTVIKRKGKNYCGSVRHASDSTCLFTPINAKIPDIRLFCRNPSRYEGKRVTATIDRWDSWSPNPQGHIVEILGDIEDLATESHVILLEHDIVVKPFSQAALSCLPPDDWVITAEELHKRADIRSYYVASVDPPGCKDIDDALHCRILPNGNYECGVHIADVGHFVLSGSALDVEASYRCTTVYLVERRTDMLPSILTERLCSLVQHEDRLAFSVFWEINRTSMEIVSTWFSKSVIRSKGSLTYGKAQEMIDSGSKDPLSVGLRDLLKISKVLKQRRMEMGALELSSAEVKVELDTDKLQAKNLSLYKPYETNSMVEEFMLLANVAVAAKTLEAYPSYSILRRHPAPKLKELTELIEKLGGLGYKLTFETSKALSDSLKQLVRPNDPLFTNVVRMQVTRCMNQAVYFCSSEFDESEYHHYGLAASVYTHFTSPIRRYADILVHRLLAAALDVKSLPEIMTDRREMAKICQRMNIRHRMAQFAGSTSTSLHTYLFFKHQAATSQEQAVVTDFLPSAIAVFVPRYGLEGEIECQPDYVKLSDVSVRTAQGRTIQLYDHVAVSISISFSHFRKTISLALA